MARPDLRVRPRPTRRSTAGFQWQEGPGATWLGEFRENANKLANALMKTSVRPAPGSIWAPAAGPATAGAGCPPKSASTGRARFPWAGRRQAQRAWIGRHSGRDRLRRLGSGQGSDLFLDLRQPIENRLLDPVNRASRWRRQAQTRAPVPRRDGRGRGGRFENRLPASDYTRPGWSATDWSMKNRVARMAVARVSALALACAR